MGGPCQGRTRRRGATANSETVSQVAVRAQQTHNKHTNTGSPPDSSARLTVGSLVMHHIAVAGLSRGDQGASPPCGFLLLLAKITSTLPSWLTAAEKDTRTLINVSASDSHCCVLFAPQRSLMLFQC